MILAKEGTTEISGKAMEIVCEFAGIMNSVVNSDEDGIQAYGKLLFNEDWDEFKKIINRVNELVSKPKNENIE